MKVISKVKVHPIPKAEKRLNIPVTRFKGCTGHKSTVPLSVSTLGEILSFIQDEQEESFVSFSKRQRRLRKEDPSRYDKDKREHSPGIVIGKFSARNSSSCEEYVPLLGFDIDGLESELQVSQLLTLADAHEHIFLAFPSPSGLGLRIFTWVDSTPETHKDCYKACLDYLSEKLEIPKKKELVDKLTEQGVSGEALKAQLKNTAHLDESTSDIGRLWFISHVPKDRFILHLDSKVFQIDKNAIPKEKEKVSSPKKPSASKNGYKYEFTEEEKVANLIDQIEAAGKDITQGVENWFRIGCSLASEFGENGRELFHRVSKFHPDYTYQDTEEEYNRCLEKHKVGGITIATFYKITKDFGFKVDFEALKRNHPKVFGGTLDKTSPTPSKSPFPIVATPEFEVPDKITLPEYAHKSLGIDNGCYTWETKSNKGENTVTPISNFLICPLYLLKHQNDPKRMWLIVGQSGEQDLVCIPVKDMATPAKLRPFFEGKGVYVPSWNTTQLDALKRVLFKEEKRAEEITTLGHQPETGLYAFCNGVFDGKAFYQINKFGIVECPAGSFYIPALSSINEDDKNGYLHERKFRYENTSTSLKDWSTLMVRVYGDNGKVGIAYLIAALFRDIIINHLECFPLLFFFGPPKTGKSTCRESLMSVFGTPQTAISLGGGSTPKSFARKSAQFRNGLVCFEEYKNDINKSKQEMLKSNYDGIGYERAQMSNDNKTHSSPVYSSPIVVGQELPTKENALFSRVITCFFEAVAHQTRTDFDKLKELEGEGLGNVLLELLQQRELVERYFLKEHRLVFDRIKNQPSIHDISDRSIKNFSVILAVVKIIESNTALAFGYEDLYEICIRRMVEQENMLKRINDVSNFWQIFENRVIEGIINEGKHFRLDSAKGILSVSISRIYAEYRIQAERLGWQILDQQSLMQYLKQHPSFIAQENSNRDQKKVHFSEKESVWAYQFWVTRLEEFFESEELCGKK